MPGAVLGGPAESMGNKNGNPQRARRDAARRDTMSPLKAAFIRLIRPDYEDLRNASAARAMRDYARTRMMHGSRRIHERISR